jgi:hypothetical protein
MTQEQEKTTRCLQHQLHFACQGFTVNVKEPFPGGRGKRLSARAREERSGVYEA